jgi:hypothetical protein
MGVGVGTGVGVGKIVGTGVGSGVGNGVGIGVGNGVGIGVGNGVGTDVGDGILIGVGDGILIGVNNGVGTAVGNGVRVDAAVMFPAAPALVVAAVVLFVAVLFVFKGTYITAETNDKTIMNRIPLTNTFFLVKGNMSPENHFSDLTFCCCDKYSLCERL